MPRTDVTRVLSHTGAGISSAACALVRFVDSLLPKTPVGRTLMLLSLVAFLWICIFDPLKIDTRLDQSTQAVAEFVFQPAYKAENADAIRIIQYTQEDLNRFESPLSYAHFGQLVRVATNAGARAVFLDYRFNALPDYPAHLEQFSKELDQRRSVPVITGPIADRPAFRDLAARVIQAELGSPPDEPTDYDISDRGRFTPAAALYVAVCTGRSPPSACRQSVLDQLKNPDAMRTMVLQLQAGIFGPRDWYTHWWDLSQCPDASIHARLWSAVTGRRTEPCPRFKTWPLSAILPNDGDEARADPAELKDKIVLIGQGWGMQDDHPWPGVGAMQGVIFHAAALENLLTLGGNYIHRPGLVFGSGHLAWDHIMKLALMLLCPLLVTAATRRFLPAVAVYMPKGWQQAVFAATVLLVFGVGPIALVAWLEHQWRWTWSSILIVLAVVGPITTFMGGEELAKTLAPLDNGWTAAAFWWIVLSALAYCTIEDRLTATLAVGVFGEFALILTIAVRSLGAASAGSSSVGSITHSGGG